jgi:hypothetical protein
MKKKAVINTMNFGMSRIMKSFSGRRQKNHPCHADEEMFGKNLLRLQIA